jgi:HSP20 family protein
MNLIRYQTPCATLTPFGRFNTVADEMTRLFDLPFFGRAARFATAGWVPAFDVYEEQDALIVRAELPGLKKDQIQLTLQDDTLTVTGERKQETDAQAKDHLRRERIFGRFERTVALPFAVKANEVKAAFEDGILTITLPKADEAKPRSIALA